MKVGILSLGFVLMASCTLWSQSNRKAVFIIVDGVPADVVERLDPPGLRAIADSSGYTRSYQGGVRGTYSQTPTISAPGYNNILTGVWANKHNVVDNDIANPNYNYWNLFRLLEKKSSRYRTAVFSTWRDNRTRLIGEGLEEAGDISLDYYVDGLEHNTARFPHDTLRMFIRDIDDSVTTEAIRYIKEKGPDLTWIYLEFTDDMGHKYGDSPQLEAAVLHADSLVNAVWNTVSSRDAMFQEDWLLLVTTDHGRDETMGRDHGGQSDRERAGWIVTNSTNLNSRFRQKPAAVDIFPSICNHLGVEIPKEVAQELDGVPFIGAIDLADLRAVEDRGKITLNWTSHVADQSKAEIFISPTNNFKKGFESDKYTKVGETFIRNGRFTTSINTDATIIKILVKGPNHFATTWIVRQK